MNPCCVLLCYVGAGIQQRVVVVPFTLRTTSTGMTLMRYAQALARKEWSFCPPWCRHCSCVLRAYRPYTLVANLLMGRFRPVSSMDGLIGCKRQQAPHGLNGGPSSLHEKPLLNLNGPFFRIRLDEPVPFLGITLKTAHDAKTHQEVLWPVQMLSWIVWARPWTICGVWSLTLRRLSLTLPVFCHDLFEVCSSTLEWLTRSLDPPRWREVKVASGMCNSPLRWWARRRRVSSKNWRTANFALDGECVCRCEHARS